MADALTPDGLRRFGEVAAHHVADGGVPGLVALVARHDQVHVEVHGNSWLVDPARDLTVIVLCQRLFDAGQPPAVHRELQDAAYAALP